MPPKIRRPVPLNIRDKYDYKPNTSDASPTQSDAEYSDYEEEEEVVVPPRIKTETQAKVPQKKVHTPPPPVVTERPLAKQPSFDDRPGPVKSLRRPAQIDRHRRPVLDSYDYGYKQVQRDPVESRPRHELRRPVSSSTAQPLDVSDDEYYDDEDYEAVEPQPKRLTNLTTNSRREPVLPPKSTRPLLRVVKRPFLPSRGGSPYLPRGLQPIGRKVKIESQSPVDYEADNIETTTGYYEKNFQRKSKDEQHRRKQPVEPIVYQQQEYLSDSLKAGKPSEDRPHIRQNFADINENEYDVTLNDALNPTLPNLAPLRNSPSGFVPKLQSAVYSDRNGQSYRGQTYYSEPSASNIHFLRTPIDRSAYQ